MTHLRAVNQYVASSLEATAMPAHLPRQAASAPMCAHKASNEFAAVSSFAFQARLKRVITRVGGIDRMAHMARSWQHHNSSALCLASVQGTNAHIVLGRDGLAYFDDYAPCAPLLHWQHHRFWTGPLPSLLLLQHTLPVLGSTCVMQASLRTAAYQLGNIHVQGACVLPLTPVLELATACYASMLGSESLELATILGATAASRLTLGGHQHVLFNCTVNWQTASCLLQPEYSSCQPQLQLLHCTFVRLIGSQAASKPRSPFWNGALGLTPACAYIACPFLAATAALACPPMTLPGWQLLPSLSEAAEALHQACWCTAPMLAFACFALPLQSSWKPSDIDSSTEQARLTLRKATNTCTDLHLPVHKGAVSSQVRLSGLSMSPIRPAHSRQHTLCKQRMPFGKVEPR